MRTLRAIILSSLLLLVAAPVWGRVFVEWTEPAAPSAASIGVRDLVIPWGPDKIQLMKAAKEHGFHVFARASVQSAAAAANAAAANGLAGIIIESGSDGPGQKATRRLAEKLRRSHAGLSVLELDGGGKQPQIRGNLVVKRSGVLQVSSPTREPWIDSNVALARFGKAFQPGQVPLFSFSWDLADPVEQQHGPGAEDYSLAVAEAGSVGADVVLPVYPNLQKGLAQGDKTAWREWDRVKRFVSFYSEASRHQPKPLADVAVVTENYQDAYEAMNLFARRNITFRVLRPRDVTAQRLSGAKLAIMFSHPDGLAAGALQAFARAGGSVLLVDQHGPFPWQALPAVKTANGTTYKAGHGEIIESSQPVGNPDEFARSVRDLLRRQGPLIYLWNAITTLGFAYRAPREGGMVLELVNYAQEPLEVQVRVKGAFPNVRYETPEHGLYPALTPDVENGYTQFVVSHLEIGARVYLGTKGNQPK
jgi:hypothetical protein